MKIAAIALRGMTILPGMVAHFDISRDKSIKAVEAAMNNNQRIFLVTQRDAEVDTPKMADLFEVGLSDKVKELTGITDEELQKASPIEEVIKDFLQFADKECLLGHHILFDYSFLKRAAVNSGFTFEREGIDTLRIARRFLTELESRNLGFLCKHYQIPLEEAHRAYHDANAAHLLYQRLCEEFYDKEAATFLPKKLLYGVKKEVPMTPRQKTYILGLAEKYHITIEDGQILLPPVLIPKLGDRLDIEHMTKNEASRLIDCLLSRMKAAIDRLPSDCEE